MNGNLDLNMIKWWLCYRLEDLRMYARPKSWIDDRDYYKSWSN